MMKFKIDITNDAILMDSDKISDIELRKIYLAIQIEMRYRISILSGEEDKSLTGEE